MIRIPALQTALMGLVGLRPHYSPNIEQYAPDLLECRSGVYLNDVHPLITPENLIAALPKYNPAAYPVVVAGVTPFVPYKRGQLFRMGVSLFMVIEDLQGDAGDFQRYIATDYNSAKLRQMLDSAAAQLANAIVQQKILDGAKSVINQTELYHGAGSIQNRIIKHSRFCGFEIEVTPGRDLVVRLMRVGLQADTPNPNLKLYLYHSSQSAPIRVFEPHFAGSGTFAWANLPDASFALNSDAYAPGGVFILGYYEDDLQGQIIDRERDWLNPVYFRSGCSTCNPYDVAAFQAWSEYMAFHPFSIAEEDLNQDKTLFDLHRVKYNYLTNFGLNLQVALGCDLTQFIVNNEASVADALSKQAAVNILQIFANSTENNQLAERCRQAALYQLDNRENYSPGLVKQLQSAYQAIAFDVSEKNSPCAPQTPVDTFRVSNATV